ncbi:helix-turn-helix domain-containing protein [Gordonia sputi]|uniref:helix-turn-helix domain-containing protein n=1 Tax=Gordonia sputi TaxID=36823 RepID=UPI00226DE5B4|nr:helix-turn-helix transcriptional regulator [Gordonia sputi]
MTLRATGYVMHTEALTRVLRSYRALAGLTQAELAARLGIPQTTVSKIESRERRLDLVEMQGYLTALGRSLTDLVSDFQAAVERAESARTVTLIEVEAGSVAEGAVEDVVDVAADSVGVSVKLGEVVGAADAVEGRRTWVVSVGLIPTEARETVEDALASDPRWEEV